MVWGSERTAALRRDRKKSFKRWFSMLLKWQRDRIAVVMSVRRRLLNVVDDEELCGALLRDHLDS